MISVTDGHLGLECSGITLHFGVGGLPDTTCIIGLRVLVNSVHVLFVNSYRRRGVPATRFI